MIMCVQCFEHDSLDKLEVAVVKHVGGVNVTLKSVFMLS